MRSGRDNPRAVTVDGRAVRYRSVLPAADADGARIGCPLLLIHGLGCSADAWGPTLRCLARQGLDQPVIAPDMPGYGHSPGPPEALGMGDLADWTARLMDAFGIERVHVAGNSMGCQVALALARRHPARVGALVLAGPTTGEENVPFWRTLLGLFLDGLHEPILYNGTLLRMYGQMGVRRYLATTRKMLEDDPVHHAAEVAAPCLILRGEWDAIVPDAAARKLAFALPRGAYTVVSGAAHALQFSAPDRFTTLAVAFLAGIWARLQQPAPASLMPTPALPERPPGGGRHASPSLPAGVSGA